jgi:hypothetical protein
MANKKDKNNPFLAPRDSQRKIAPIRPENWNKVFPYVFALAEANEDGSVSLIQAGKDQKSFKAPQNFPYPTQVKLVIPPSAISVATPYAIDVSATNGGVIEEHNGVVFRMISISGTTGMFPNRSFDGAQTTTLQKATNAVASFVPSTASALNRLFQSASQLGASVAGGNEPKQFPEYDSSNDSNRLDESGYYQFWYLHNFLVAYAEHKRLEKNARMRLLFQVPKDNIAYVVTPVSFSMDKDAGNPYLIKYKILLRAWDIAALDGLIAPEIPAFLPSPRNQGAIKSVLGVFRSFRNLVTANQNLLRSINADVVDMLSVFGQANHSLKLIADTKTDLIDFKDTLASNADAILGTKLADDLVKVWNKEARNGNVAARTVLGTTLSGNFSGLGAMASSLAASKTQTTPAGETVTSLSASSDAPTLNQGLKSALLSALDNPNIGEQLSVNDFPLPAAVQDAVDAQTQRARETTSNDIRDLADKIQSVSDSLAYATSSIDDEYAKTYDLEDPAGGGRALTEDDIILQASLQETKDGLLSTLATGELYQDRDSDPFVEANASLDSSDQMQSPLSMYPVTMETDATLERMALKHLGNANRAREIAILNGLRAPYIDELGFTQSISNCTGRTFMVTDVSRLEVGQFITITGTSKAPTRRQIVNIEEMGGSFRVVVSGLSNLDLYTAASTPQLRARLPGCVGGGDIILMPSPDAVVEAAERPTYLNQNLNHAEKVFKIDLAIDANGDLVLDKNGDFALAYGYANAVQALRLKLETERGELEQHPEFGLPIAIGSRTSDLTPDQAREIIQSQVLTDPRFSAADVAVEPDGTGLRVTVSAEGQAGTGKIPVSFQVGKT